MHELLSIPDGRAGLEAKVRKIRQLVEDAKRDPWIRQRAAAIVAHVAERDQDGEVRAVWEWVRDHVRYLRDPDGVEVFTTPRRLLQDAEHGAASEDCDGHVILASALIESIGYATRYRIGGLPPDSYRHIWLEARTSTGWHPLELTKKDEPFEYDPSGRFPLTLTMDGTNMLSNGLGSVGGFQRASVGRIVDRDVSEMERKRQANLERRFHDKPGERANFYKNTRRFLGDPTPMEERWNEQGRDFFDDREMLGGFSPLRRLRKLQTRTKKSIGKVRSDLNKIRSTTTKLIAPSTHLAILGKALGSLKGKSGSPETGVVTDNPADSGLSPTMVPGPNGNAVMSNPFQGWDATSQEQEINSLYTPAMAQQIGPDADSPTGEYADDPEWRGTEDAYDEPAPSWGDDCEDEETMETDDPTETYGENETIGDGWFEQLAAQVLSTGAKTAIEYQQARLAASAAKKGYGPMTFGPQPVPAAATPNVATASAPTTPVQDQSAGVPAPRAPRSGGLAKYGPWLAVGVAGILVYSLVKGSRRSR